MDGDAAEGGGVRTIALGFVNAYLVPGTEGWALVDTGVRGSHKAILAAMSSAGIEAADLSLIVATHVHVDHIGGLKELLDRAEAPLLCTRKAAEFLASGTSAPIVPRTRLARALSSLFPDRRVDPVSPSIVFDDELDLGPYGFSGKALRTPGHTEDSLSLFLDSGDAIVGDLLRGAGRKLSFGFTYQDPQECRRSAEAVLASGARRIFLSHGGQTDAESLRAFLSRL